MAEASLYWINSGRLPGYAQAAGILAETLDVLTPPDNVPPSVVYRQRVHEGKEVRLDDTPYMAEPLDMTVSRRYKGLAFVGPARTGKTFFLVEGAIFHRVISDPCPIHVVQMTQDAAKLFSRQKIDPMIRHSPPILQRLVARSGLGNIYDKQFRGDCHLTIGWPVASQLASRDIQVVIITDRDRMPDDIDGEGDIFPMALKRGQTFGSRAMAIVESSPGRDIEDETWSATTPHAMPPATGVVGLYNRSTRGRYYWRCPHCRDRFEPSYGLLQVPDGVSPGEAGEKAWMACPKCGGEILPSMKRRLNIEALTDPDAGWLHEAEDGVDLVPITSALVRRTDTVGYAINGMHAGFQTWSEIVQKTRTAEAEYEATGFEGSLKAVINTDHGLPYLPRARVAGLDLAPQALIDRAQFRPLGTAPAQARFVTVQVDVQGNRFVCSAEAWGEGLEHWLIDRWEISQSEASAPARRALAPHLYREDWEPLAILHDRVFPVEGADYGLKPIAVIIDSGGMPGVTDKAYTFWRAMRRRQLTGIYHLYKGVGGLDGPRAKLREPDTATQKRRDKARAVRIVFASANRLKDEVVSGLARPDPGPHAYHLTSALPRPVFEEYCAERRAEDGWVKRAAHLRNESLDLAVFAKAVVIVKGGEGIRDWAAPPAWAAAGKDNSFAVPVTPDGKPAGPARKTETRTLAEIRAGFIKGQ